MTKTENYNLNQWDPTDRVLREDFNADNAKIDVALSGMPRIATGSYKGNGKLNTTEEIQALDCGFPPQVVIILRSGGNTSFSGLFVRPCTQGLSRFDNNAVVKVIWKDTGVGWCSTSSYVDEALNTSGVTYYWWAIG